VDGFNWLWESSEVDTCEYGNELFGSMKSGKYLDQLSDYQLLKKAYIPWNDLKYALRNYL
jgi:hypothetical protein